MINNNSMNITLKLNEINILSLQFLILLINDFLIYIIFSIWYLLFQYEIIKSPNPLFAYIITLFYNLIILFFMIYKKISINKILIYLSLIFILKIIPIYYMITYYNLSIDLISIYVTIIILFNYILILIIVNNILLHKDINLLKIFTNSIINYDSNNDINNKFISIDYN